MQWYYLSDSHERIAFSEAQFMALAARGVLRPVTPVWRKGMNGWAPCGEVRPEVFAAAVARGSDGRNPMIDDSAARGTVIGLGRVLASANVWLRILGGFLLVLAVTSAAILGWEIYALIRFGVEIWKDNLVAFPVLTKYGWMLWLSLGLQSLLVVINAWIGLLLFRAAARAKVARESGSEQALAGAIQDLGRYFMVTAIMIILSVIVWLALFLWIGRDRAFGTPPVRPEKSVVI